MGFEIIQNYYIPLGNYEYEGGQEFILTQSFISLLKILASAVSNTQNAVLIEGPTSAGKTSTITYLAELTKNKCIRINNHEHTDIQEYIGSYVPDNEGRLVF